MSGTESYLDLVVEETKSKKSRAGGKIAFRNWVTAYADAKAKDLILETFDRFITLDPDARILDVGCGPGKWTRLFAGKGFFTIGIDANVGMISLARERTNDSVWERIQLYVMNVAKLGFRDGVFDFVNCVTVLQHNLDDQIWMHAVQEINRVTKPDGHILFYEVATAFPFKKRTQSLRFHTVKEYENAFAEYGTHLVFSLPTDTSFPLTVFSLREFSTALVDDVYCRTGLNEAPALSKVRSMVSKTVARIAGQVDYTLGKTPLGILSPLRIMLFKKR